jgi:hypothetical protein
VENRETQKAANEKSESKKYFDYTAIVRNLPFIFFLSFLAVLYIYNGHLADKLGRQIGRTEKNVKELEYEYKTLKSEVIFRSKASELIRAVEPLGLKELTEAPVRLKDSINTEKN